MIEIAGPTTYINKVWQLKLSSKQWSCSLWSNLAPDLPKTMLEIWYHTCRDKTIQISGFFKLLYTHLINEQTCFLFSLWTFIGSLKRFNVVNDQLPNSMWSAATFYECFVYLFWSFLHVYFLSIFCIMNFLTNYPVASINLLHLCWWPSLEERNELGLQWEEQQSSKNESVFTSGHLRRTGRRSQSHLAKRGRARDPWRVT